LVNEGDPYVDEALFHSHIVLDQQYVAHKREIYNMFDLLGDLGGVIQVVMICGSVLIGPISYHSFVLKAIRRIYLANTCSDELFASKNGHGDK
jgi:hypothetical protein